MTAIDLHEWILRSQADPATTYRVIDGTVDLDDEWSPMSQASMTLADEPPSPIGNIEWLLLELYQSVGAELQHLRDLTENFQGLTLAAITEAWEEHTFAEIVADYDRQFDPSNLLEPTGRTVRLMVRQSTQNPDGTWSVTLESGESAFAEWIAAEPRELTGISVSRAIDNFFDPLGTLPFGDTLTIVDDGPVPVGLISDSPTDPLIPMEPGESLLNAVSSSLQSANLRIVDFGAGAQLVSADWTNPDTIELSDDVSVLSAPPSLERTDWFEELVVVYSKDKTNPAIPYYGTSRGTGAPPFPTTTEKRRTITIDAPAPFRSSAQGDIEKVLRPIVDRMKHQGVKTQVEAVARYDAFPRCTVVVDVDGATYTGRASRITYRLADRLMSLDIRQVVIS